MYELFFKSFNEKVSLSADEERGIKNYLTPKKLRKKQYLLQEGDVCKVTAFVEQGSLRSYSMDDNGGEHIIQFAIEGWTISDLYSFLTGEPATYNIDALEDAELVIISKSAHEELLKKFPKYETYNSFVSVGNKSDFFVIFHIEKIRAYKMLIPVRTTSINRRGIHPEVNFCRHKVVASRIDACFKFFENTFYICDHKVLYFKSYF